MNFVLCSLLAYKPNSLDIFEQVVFNIIRLKYTLHDMKSLRRVLDNGDLTSSLKITILLRACLAIFGQVVCRAFYARERK